MDWQVLWSPPAEGQLAARWLDSGNREAVRRASYLIDEQLRKDPFSSSESREGDSRIMFEPPLIIDYRVDEGRKKVVVLAVRDMTRRE